MKQITLYSATKQIVQSYNLNSIPQYCYPPIQDILSVRNSDILLDKQEVEVKHLPVERFCWGNKDGVSREIYAAFDEELREIIGCSQEKFQRDVQTATDRRVNQQYQALLLEKSELETLKGMNLWQRLAWAISGICVNK